MWHILPSLPSPPRIVEIKGWRGFKGDDCAYATYRGEMDAAGLPHGYGVVTYSNGDFHEGAHTHGRRQGTWVFNMYRLWCSVQFKDDVFQSDKVRPRNAPHAPRRDQELSFSAVRWWKGPRPDRQLPRGVW